MGSLLGKLIKHVASNSTSYSVLLIAIITTLVLRLALSQALSSLIFPVLVFIVVTMIGSWWVSRRQLNRTLVRLRNSNQRYTLFSRNAQGFALIFLSPSGIIRDWNEGAENLLRFSAQDIVHQPFSQLFSRGSQAFSVETWQHLSNEIFTKGSVTEEMWLTLPNNEQMWCQITFVSLKNAANKVIGIGVICRDRTGQKELELQKDAFLDGASHELKTPLTSIKLLTQLLIKKKPTDPQTKTYLHKINSQVDRMVELTNMLLDVGKLQKQSLKLEFSIIPFTVMIGCLAENFDQGELKITIPESVEGLEIVGEEKRLVSALFQFGHYLVTDIGTRKPVEVWLDNDTTNDAVIMSFALPGVQRDAWLETEALLGKVTSEFYTNKKGDKGVGLFFATHIFELHEIELTSNWSATNGLKIQLRIPTLPTSTTPH